MEHAWMDSLSEDWVSQPRSGSPEPSLPSLSHSTSSNLRASISRIPKYDPRKQSWAAEPISQEMPLAERTQSDNNIPTLERQARRPSKRREELSNSTRGQPSRRASTSSTQSAEYNTMQHHKATSLSPQKISKETPEWKRRLLQGDVAYGEQRDLFSPAGLENIFRPPPPGQVSPSRPSVKHFEDESIIMPSSPPPFDIHGDPLENPKDGLENRNKPRVVQYRLASDDDNEFSTNDISCSSNFRPAVSQSDAGDRKISGQTVRNEKLSPIIIPRHHTIDGLIDYGGLDLSAKELQNRLEDLNADSQAESDVDKQTNASEMPENMTADTEEFARNGRFVNLRRGGHSQEGSFQRRMLSPSSLPAIDESALLPEESMQASTPKVLPNIKKTRQFRDDFEEETSNEYKRSKSPSSTQNPQTPQPSPSKTKGVNASSGSPLKLFGTYDTFTNQKLLRRLSQFEENFDGTDDIDAASLQNRESTNHELNEAFVAPSSPEKPNPYDRTDQHKSRRLSNFGVGELDDFQFNEISYNSANPSSDDEEDKENQSLPPLDPKSQTKFKFQLEPSPALEDNVSSQRRTPFLNTTKILKHSIRVRKIVRSGGALGSEDDSLLLSNVLKEVTSDGDGFGDESSLSPTTRLTGHLTTPRKRDGDSEGKRLRNSPQKDPTPKRRRTLHQEDIAQAKSKASMEESESILETHNQIQSVVGKKRKDARHDNDQQAANPSVLAMRQILRPRTPTPSQRSSIMRDREPLTEIDLDSIDRSRLLREQKIAKVQAELDSTDPPRPHLLGKSLQMQNESRKGSVTTQDFLDEAKKIMAGIRGKNNRPRSGLTSLEESESENAPNLSFESELPSEMAEESYEESTAEPFSRPPSRDGAPVSRHPLQQHDPAVLDHLRRYQEGDDLEDLILSSMKSMEAVKAATDFASEVNRKADATISRSSGSNFLGATDLESDPPNIRISESQEFQRKRKHSNSTVQTNEEDHVGADFPSQGSTASTQSIPTGSSRGSDSRRVIAPHTVSHLIPEHVAGMIFDRERNTWVKRKTVSGEGKPRDFLPSDDTEDDPFGDIPDLSVDETQELQRIKAVAAKKKQEERAAEMSNTPRPEEARQVDSHIKAGQHDGPSSSLDVPKSKDVKASAVSPKPILKSAERQQTGSVKSAHTVGTSEFSRTTSKTTGAEPKNKLADDVEKEISILEDRVHIHTTSSPTKRRNVTISFSSPIASVIQMSPTTSPRKEEKDFGNSDKNYSPSDDGSEDKYGNDSIVVTKHHMTSKTSSMRMRTALRKSSRHISLEGHTFSARPVSRIDEHEEEEEVSDSDIDDLYRRSVSLLVATSPAPSRKVSTVVQATPARPPHEIGTLELTPMSDFTMRHEEEEPLGMEVSYIERGQRYVPGTDSKNTLSQTIKQLVESITEVEPYEPYWEYVKRLSLRDKRVKSLHMLDEFCGNVVELDVSNNQISHLNGAPAGIRHLRIAHNRLTVLTAWGHLSNLQYVDVSNNELESLSGISSLVHLRSLKADNNKIVSLDGTSNLDSLLSLRMRGNLVDSLDFKSTKLQRLADLDLSDNCVRDIQNLCELPSLSSLNLDGNKLNAFVVTASTALPNLHNLRLSRNDISSIDVSHCRNLRMLYLDQNRLGQVTGLFRTQYLDSLSMREQQDGAIIDPSFLDAAFEVRKLFLSGNLLSTFKPREDFLNLQYLELANCGLESLPDTFGQMFRNLRVLNLNFNALRDIQPLTGILRLKRLHLAGNRFSDVKPTARIISRFPLALLDLRSNPLTVGFYPPLIDTNFVLRDGQEDLDQVRKEEFSLGMCDPLKDARYTSRLDAGTKVLRRAYEKVFIDHCRRLKTLDGLEVDRTAASSEAQTGEDVTKSLEDMNDARSEVSTVRVGGKTLTIRRARNRAGLDLDDTRSEMSSVRGERRKARSPRKASVEEVTEESERWGIEDSFA